MFRIKVIFGEFLIYIGNHLANRIPFHCIRHFWYKNVMRFDLDSSATICLGVSFDCRKNFKMGTASSVNGYCRIDSRGSVEIGDNVSISEDVIILTGDHDASTIDLNGRIRPVFIQDYVWVGTRAMILPGVTLARGSVVAAGAVVTKSTVPFEVVAGVPAVRIGMRPNSSPEYSAFYRRWFH